MFGLPLPADKVYITLLPGPTTDFIKKEVPFVRQGISRNFLLHQKNPAVKLSYRIKNPCKTTQLPDLFYI